MHSPSPQETHRNRLDDSPLQQPSLAAFPAGLLGCAVAFDMVALLGGGATIALVAYRMMVVGLASAALLAALGWWRRRGTSAAGGDGGRGVMPFQMVNGVVLLLFVASGWVRRAHDGLATPTALGLSFAAAALTLLAMALGRRQPTQADAGTFASAPNATTAAAPPIGH